ncbi:hypothetical protein ACFQZ2_01710 [Streptomonospora algeriensis]|uniref:Uncharacterized protein n=1 Tax=Streptomonospora algeriensis TaxID=995084 RepID=A0ABW3BB59_9ACTN
MSTTPTTRPEWQLRTLRNGRTQEFIPVGEIFAGAAVLDIVMEPDDPGVGWPRVCTIIRELGGGKRERLVIAAVDSFEVDLDAAIASAKAQAADAFSDPIHDGGTGGLRDLTDEQVCAMADAIHSGMTPAG